MALNQRLTLAARAHAADMAARQFFDHVNPEGDDPSDRAGDQGYAGSVGENIAAGYTDVDDAHVAWLESLGHRRNVFSLHANFTATFHYDEFGFGFATTSAGQYHRYFAQSFGYQGVNRDLYALGVVYRDANNNDFYTVGEGAANVLVEVHLPDDPTYVVGSYTTDEAGNYQIVLGPGDYIIRFTDSATGKVLTRPLSIADINIKVDADPIDFLPLDDPILVTDDHPNFGAFSTATVVPLDSRGDGSINGRLSPATDTDFFKFTPAAGGLYTITVRTPGSSLNPRARLYDAAGVRIALGTNSGALGDEWEILYSMVGGRTYYLNVEAATTTSTGTYTLQLEAPVDDPGDDDDDDDDGDNSADRYLADATGATQVPSNSAGRITIVTVSTDALAVATEFSPRNSQRSSLETRTCRLIQ